MKMGEWIDENTPHNSTVLIPPEWFEIKIWSRRPSVILTFELGWCVYKKDLAASCKKRFNDVTAVYNQTSTAEFLRIAEKYDVQYIVTYDKGLDLPEIFNAGNFKLYRI